MDDVISRQAAIKTINKVRDVCDTESLDDYRDLLVECFEVMPTAQPEQRWIPCSKKLPMVENNNGARVLITTSWGLVREAYYCVNHWEIGDIPYKLSSVVAWKPLPEPYKGDAE